MGGFFVHQCISKSIFLKMYFQRLICSLNNVQSRFPKSIFQIRSHAGVVGWSWESVQILGLGGERARDVRAAEPGASIRQDLWGLAQVKITVFGEG